ncbi:MAG: ferrochelatase [Nitrospinota bacterium]
MQGKFDGILLMGFGGPTRREEVRPFLERVLRNRKVPQGRIDEVEHHYEVCGGRSPFTDLTFRQARALNDRLERSGLPLPVYTGMRNWHPFIKDVIETMACDGVRVSLGVILAPHRAKASWEAYQTAVGEALRRLGDKAPRFEYLDGWHDHPLFIEAVAERVREVLDGIGEERRKKALLVFTAHSIPTGMAKQSPYVEQFTESSAAVAERLEMGQWTTAYQSRSGNPREPWLEPDVKEVLGEYAGRGFRDIVLVPIGFLCDHTEVLYDLDVEARQVAEGLGVRLLRAGTVGDHPRFIEMLAEKIRARVSGAQA